jgi:hypothetical protein
VEPDINVLFHIIYDFATHARQVSIESVDFRWVNIDLNHRHGEKMQIFKLMVSMARITLALASPFSYGQSQSAAAPGTPSGEEQSNALVKTRLLAS